MKKQASADGGIKLKLQASEILKLKEALARRPILKGPIFGCRMCGILVMGDPAKPTPGSCPLCAATGQLAVGNEDRGWEELVPAPKQAVKTGNLKI